MKKLYVFILMTVTLMAIQGFNVYAQSEEIVSNDAYTTEDMTEGMNETEITNDIVKTNIILEDVLTSIVDEITEEIIEEDIVEELEEDNEKAVKVAKVNKKEKVSAKTSKSNKKVNNTVKKSYTNEELKLLACLIHAEAGGQPYKGKLAVANVVLNRVKSNLYPNTIKTVIYDRKWAVQFSVTVNGALPKQLANYKNFNTASHKESIKAAKEALEGTNNIGTYLRFTRYSSSLASKYKNHEKIGDHIFY